MLMENQIKHSNIKLKLLILLGFDFLFALNKHDVLYEAKTHKCACECSECIPNMVIIFISSSWRFSAIYLVFTLDCMLSFAPYVNRIPNARNITHTQHTKMYTTTHDRLKNANLCQLRARL